MKLRYTDRAARQIDAALHYIAERSPRGAALIQERILAMEILLQNHPYAGRATSRPDARRIALTPYPYLVDYLLGGEEIIIMRFRHSSRRPM